MGQFRSNGRRGMTLRRKGPFDDDLRLLQIMLAPADVPGNLFRRGVSNAHVRRRYAGSSPRESGLSSSASLLR